MKHKSKFFITVLFGTLIVIILIIGKLYLIGEPIDGIQLSYTTVVNNQTLELEVNSIESSMALCDWKLEKDGTITVRKILVSPFNDDGTFKTVIALDDIDTILLGGHLIWSK